MPDSLRGKLVVVDGLIAILVVVVASLAMGNARGHAHAKAPAAQRLSASQEAAGPKT